MFTDIVKRDRERWGMSEAQAARRFLVSVSAYREIEAGERFLEFDTYDAICKLFRVAAVPFTRSAAVLPSVLACSKRTDQTSRIRT